MTSEDDRPKWDQTVADSLEGAVILVGITYNEPSGPRLEQLFSTVVALDETKGITLRLGGSRSGGTFTLPPDLQAIFPAEPGSFRLRHTGEVVDNPDYTATWEVTPREPPSEVEAG